MYALLLATAAVQAEAPSPGEMAVCRLLDSAGEPVKIVCLGDSITGVYYHTGGRRAWPEMLGIALQRLYPRARIEVANAGISGDTTAGGLARLEEDVARHKPHLVVIMFGMNDVCAYQPQQYRANLMELVTRARAVGAEVVLCTPNSVYPEDPGRPMERLAEYAAIVREIGADLGVPVADCWAAYEGVRAADRRAWMGLMSETIHPNMRGHKLFAEEVAWTVSGRRVSLADVGPGAPRLPFTAAAVARGETVDVVAMEPAYDLIEPALGAVFPGAKTAVTKWPAEGQSLAQIEAQAKDRGWWFLREKPAEERPTLVVIAVPPTALAETDEAFYRSYSWILNWSLSFGAPEWDCIVLLPSLTAPDLDAGERAAEAFARYVVEAQDIPWLARAEGDGRPAAELLADWLRAAR